MVWVEMKRPLFACKGGWITVGEDFFSGPLPLRIVDSKILRIQSEAFRCHNLSYVH